VRNRWMPAVGEEMQLADMRPGVEKSGVLR
jgi:hypothetical protein